MYIACYFSFIEIGNLSCKCARLAANSWIIDSGASHHMTYTKNALTNLRTLPYPSLITLPNGYKVKVTEIGDVCLSSTLTLYKVLFIPSFKFNLISVHCLALQLKGTVSFDSSSCLLQGPSLKSPLALGRARNGLYFFCPKCHSCGPTSGGLSHVICCSTDCFSNYQHVSSSVKSKQVLTGTECQTSKPSNVKCSHVSNK